MDISDAGRGTWVQAALTRTGVTLADPCAQTEIVLLDPKGAVVGRLRFRSCHQCRTGRILDIWIFDTWQRQGLGRELIELLLVYRPDHKWSTTLQTEQGRAFFATMACETAVEVGDIAASTGRVSVSRLGAPTWKSANVG